MFFNNVKPSSTVKSVKFVPTNDWEVETNVPVAQYIVDGINALDAMGFSPEDYSITTTIAEASGMEYATIRFKGFIETETGNYSFQMRLFQSGIGGNLSAYNLNTKTSIRVSLEETKETLEYFLKNRKRREVNTGSFIKSLA